MPVEGYTSITVSDETYNALKDFAEKTHRSIPQVVEYLLEKHKETKPT